MSTDTSHQWSSPKKFGWLQFLHLEQFQEEHGLKSRPCIIIWIGIIDILAAVYYTTLTVDNILYHPDSLDRRSTREQAYFFLGMLGIFICLVMGVYLLKGLKNENNKTTLWYCRLWMAFQVIFFVASVLDITSVILLIISDSRGKWESVSLIVTAVTFAYRVGSFCLMWAFTKTLQQADSRTCEQGQEDAGNSITIKPKKLDGIDLK